MVVADVNDAGGRETVGAIKSGGAEAMFVHTDVSLAADVERLIATVIEKFGRLDILFNNAGIFMKQTRVEEIEDALWDRIYAVNVRGIFLGVKYSVPELRKAGGGVIINTASMLGLRPGPNLAAYASSKGAVIALTKGLALELAPYHIRVNCICPMLTDTPMINIDSAERRSALASGVPLGRVAQPEDMANAALFLASDESAMLSGTTINVNGGQIV